MQSQAHAFEEDKKNWEIQGEEKRRWIEKEYISKKKELKEHETRCNESLRLLTTRNTEIDQKQVALSESEDRLKSRAQELM